MSLPVSVLDIETTGLDQKVDRITAIGVMDADGVRIYANQDESSLLRRFAEREEDLKEKVFVTYNGEKFDIPFINTRVKKHPELVQFTFQAHNHIDMITFDPFNKKRYCTKEEMARNTADIYSPSTTSAKFLARAYTNGLAGPLLHAKLMAHNSIDLTTTWSAFWENLHYLDFQTFYKVFPSDDKWQVSTTK